MKKYLFILGLTGIALFSGCSSADELDAEAEAQRVNEEVIKAGMDSEIPISLSTGHSASDIGTITRSPVESDAGTGNFTTPDGTFLGVFLLAQKPQIAVSTPGPLAENGIVWNTSLYSARMWNQPAKAVRSTTWAETSVSEFTNINFYAKNDLNGDPHVYYYPYGNWYNYYFYTYYPRVDDAQVSITNNKITVPYTLDGSQDIIAGMATPPSADLNKGFCAKYFRDIKTAASSDYVPFASLPNMELKHKLAQVRFYVKKNRSTGYVFKLKNLVLYDIPTEWNLVVADKTGSSASCVMESRSAKVTGSGAGDATPIPIRQMNPTVNPVTSNDYPKIDPADGDTWYTLTTTDQFVGYAMIPTSDMISDANTNQSRSFISPRFVIECDYNGEEIPEYATPVSIQLPTSGKFLPGKVYNVYLNIPVPEDIASRATLSNWAVTAEEGSEDIIMNDLEGSY